MTSFRDQIASVIVCVRIAVFCQETIIVVVGIFRDDAIVVLCQAVSHRIVAVREHSHAAIRFSQPFLYQSVSHIIAIFDHSPGKVFNLRSLTVVVVRCGR